MRQLILMILFACGMTAISAEHILPWLKTEHAKIVDANGKRVILRGVHLGGWLVEEMSMMPFVTEPPPHSKFKPITDHVSLWDVVKSRFGEAHAEEIRHAFRSTWLRESDFAKIHAAGLNCVRLP